MENSTSYNYYGVAGAATGFFRLSPNWNADNWSKYVTSGSVPAGAQSFVMTYKVNSGIDGYADNLTLEISE
jgi:hypothetical protein